MTVNTILSKGQSDNKSNKYIHMREGEREPDYSGYNNYIQLLPRRNRSFKC